MRWRHRRRGTRCGTTAIRRALECRRTPPTLLTESAAWHTLGPDYTFTTPVQAVGERVGSTFNGNLSLVAQGDLTMGGRTRADGSVDYTSFDHTYADSAPGAILTPEDPLAGIDQLAQQVHDAGITQVNGDVVVDARKFTPPALDPKPTR
ncbi:D-alanyl-D-alanine carboxypeptidase [Kitasatospora sp. MAA4]|uniref:D-alanyl-D-alanine carboxypeptidase n=1 Tax=Kitasatospora sp. MAA4 TaxID=3035093 RepID=UPI002472EC93|nr:D-alanyl-D-alanine carboxypeptidase [Kitasatospora sp. MAA4]MDH6133519.1 D-alanyl-D-alanine carboxypeptidase [Kitasatospora sp. MAA4]